MKNILRNFLLFNLQFDEHEREIKYRFIFLNNVFFFAGVVALGMGFVRWQHSMLMGMIDFGFSIIGFSLLYYLRHHKEKIEGISTLALMLTFLLFYAIYILAPYNTLRLALFFLLSASALFLKGRKKGLLWTLFILVTVILGRFIPNLNTEYSWFDVVFLCINLIALFFIFDNYELIKEEQTEYLEFLNRELEKKVRERTRELHLVNETLEESEKRFRSAFDNAAIGMALVSLEGHWLKVNKSLCKIIGYTEQELLKINFQQITYPDDLQKDLNYVRQLLDGIISAYQMEKRYICKNGTIVWILLSVSLIKDAQGKAMYFISQIQNIDAQKKAEQELVTMAYHDVLTGLANRKLLEQSFKLTMAYAKRHHYMIAVLFMDLDYFKQINDVFGHNVGDLLLIEIASRLKSSVRSSDIVGRQGGDEFLIILSELVNEEEVCTVISHLFKAISQPFFIKQQEISITSSIGISMYPEDASDIDTLIKQADAALYEVKSEGRNNYKFYTHQ
ncbi:sensor domain-containing diguanylate cyclase [Legionella quateirensis]|uniref:Diguanylate kinase n=1 Tax=Legionella quateirensis TaxID=45072 RepID=A0A378KWL2_9GAMM|nr:sensor domain-containing diguanylate cyclase [Legionella quateirensis]KTD46443.1 sensory box/GGDEF family protein [Legionella quateirensis]STY18776.1 diguanylate kinase [Legionella quateirensis]